MRNYMMGVLLCLSVSALYAAEGGFKISHGPYIQNIGQTSATIVWTTNAPAVSWVEIAPNDGTHFYATEREKFFDSPLGKKEIGQIHRITIDELQKASKYNYRIFSREVLSDDGNNGIRYGAVASSTVYKVKPLTFKTLNPDSSEIVFATVNDIHAENEKLKALLAYADKNCDFFVMNGDMVSAMQSEEQIFKGFLDTFVEATKSSKPIFLSRGNHESRGNFAPEYLKYFPTSTGKPYYAVKIGRAFFIFLDGGEDKPDSDIEYSGTADFDKYRSRQAKWLEEVVNSEDFKASAARIVVVHIPPAWGAWHGSLDFKKKFAPVLNGTGIDLILSGHLHKMALFEADSAGFDAPNVVNDNKSLVNARIGKSKIVLEFVGADGKPSREALEIPLKSSKAAK